MPARNGDWKRFGSVAVTQFQRRVCRKALKWRGGSKRRAPNRAPRLLLEDAAVDLEVPVDLQGLPLGVVVGAREADARGRGQVAAGFLHRLHQPAPRADLDQLAHPERAVRQPFGGPDQRRHRPLIRFLVRRFALPGWDEVAAREGRTGGQGGRVRGRRCR